MDRLLASGRAADIIFAVLAIEAVWLLLKGWRAVDTALLLLPAACFVLALRAALTGAAWPWIALPLAAAFPLHLADLRGRRRR